MGFVGIRAGGELANAVSVGEQVSKPPVRVQLYVTSCWRTCSVQGQVRQHMHRGSGCVVTIGIIEACRLGVASRS
jgi:hypothetical protein